MSDFPGRNDFHNHLPRSLKLWAQIEEKAQQRAQKRFEEIMKKERNAAPVAKPDAAGHI